MSEDIRPLIKRALLIGTVWPEIRSSAAGFRDWNLVRWLKTLNYEVTYSSPSKSNEYRSELEKAGILTHEMSANDSSHDTWLKSLNPELVVFDRFIMEEQFGWRVKSLCPEALRIVDSQDLHFLRRARRNAIENSKSSLELWTEDTYRELASFHRSDGVLILSDFEMDLLQTPFDFPRAKQALLRFGYPKPAPSQTVLRSLPLSQRGDFSILGNFRHAPNRDGIFWFAKQIWPEIRSAFPNDKLVIAGAYPPREVMALDSKANQIEVRGWVEDQFDFLSKMKVNLAPLRFGAGIKGKITDAWSVGTPTLTSSLGAEGMLRSREGNVFEFGGIVISALDQMNPEVWKKGLEKLGEESTWKQAQDRGFQCLESCYSDGGECAELEKAIAQWSEFRKSGNKSLIEEILWLNQNRSTEYFSRWIEQKNK